MNVILFILFAVLMWPLTYFGAKKTFNFNVKILKIILVVIAFILTIYFIMIIIFIAGQLAIQTFCRVLAEVNKGNGKILDELPMNFTNFNKLVIKECTVGTDGDLLKYAHLYMTPANYMYNVNIQTIYPGFLDYSQFISVYP